MEYIKRNMEDIFFKLNEQYPAILITGPRQVGKTTMLKQLMGKDGRKRDYVTLDDLNERALAKNDPKMFLQLHKPPVFIDEVQYAPELFTYIKIHIDNKQSAGDFWLTGSQIFKLMEGVQESLAGRVALLHLSSLSQQEIYSHNNYAFSRILKFCLKSKKILYLLQLPKCLKEFLKEVCLLWWQAGLRTETYFIQAI